MKRIIKKIIDKAFELVVLAKSFFGIVEILLGTILAISGRLAVSSLITDFAKQEVLEDPKDFLANYIISALNSVSAGTYLFAVIYMMFHGIMNIFLAISLAKNKMWAYPCAISAFSAFILYQIYKYFHTQSFLLLLLTILDVLVVLIIYLEYRNKKKVKK